ncbi:hypothetical protein ACFXCN_24055, partial [Streptomyces coelicoflavus]
MDVSQIAKRFPLVARPRPACPPLAERVREITDLAAAAERDGNVTSATVALNKAALIASDCSMPDLARTLCWRHAEAVLRAPPPGGPGHPEAPVTRVEPAPRALRARGGARAKPPRRC